MKKIVLLFVLWCSMSVQEVMASNGDFYMDVGEFIGSLSHSNNRVVVSKKSVSAAIIMNYLHSSMYAITKYNDRVVLDQQYEDIINNINIRKIEDEEVVSLITHLMDTLSQFSLSDRERKFLRDEYEKNIENALIESFYRVSRNKKSANNSKNLVIDKILSMATGGGISIAVSSAINYGNVYFDYRHRRNEYKRKLDKTIWSLDRRAVEGINEIRKDFFVSYWKIMNKYDIPDGWRITEKQLGVLYEATSEINAEKRYRKLKRMKKHFDMFPLYWVFMASSAKDVGNVEDLRDAILHYEELDIGLLRSNVYTGMMLEFKTTLYDVKNEKKELRRILNRIMTINGDDHNRKMFVALKYAQIGDVRKAVSIINENIDDGKFVSASLRVKAEIASMGGFADEYEKAIHDMISRHWLSVYDYFHFVGVRYSSRINGIITNGIKAVDMRLSRSLYGDDDIEVKINNVSLFGNIGINKFRLNIGGDYYSPSDLEKDENGIKLVFESVVNRQDLLDGRYSWADLYITPNRKDIVMRYAIIPEETGGKGKESTHDEAWLYGGSIGIKVAESMDSIQQGYSDMSYKLQAGVGFNLKRVRIGTQCFVPPGTFDNSDDFMCKTIINLRRP